MPDNVIQVEVEAQRHNVSPATARAVDRLSQGPPGALISRKEMAEVIGICCDVGSAGYRHVYQAIQIVRREHGVVWKWSRAEQAWKCLADAERVGAELHELQRSRRAAKRSLEIARTVDASQLSEELRRDHALNSALAGVICMLGSSQCRKTIAARPDAGHFPEPKLDQVLGLFHAPAPPPRE